MRRHVTRARATHSICAGRRDHRPNLTAAVLAQPCRRVSDPLVVTGRAGVHGPGACRPTPHHGTTENAARSAAASTAGGSCPVLWSIGAALDSRRGMDREIPPTFTIIMDASTAAALHARRASFETRALARSLFRTRKSACCIPTGPHAEATSIDVGAPRQRRSASRRTHDGAARGRTRAWPLPRAKRSRVARVGKLCMWIVSRGHTKVTIPGDESDGVPIADSLDSSLASTPRIHR